MKGIELCERFYIECGKEAMEKAFPEIFSVAAIGIAGCGSECLGFDDEQSRDHDFEPGFCIFLPDEDIVDRRTAFELERLYSRLPREFMGYKRSTVSPVGGNRHGVIRISDFLTDRIGTSSPALSSREWMSLPEQALLEVVNGKIFRDDCKYFTEIRASLEYLPKDVRKKKLAGELIVMAQSGQYNYERCLSRGDTAGAQLSVTEFVKAALHAVFLINGRYMPYYKWSFFAMSELDRLSSLCVPLEYLISSSNSESSVPGKLETIERVAASVIAELRVQGLVHKEPGCELERCAYEVNGMVNDPDLRNLSIFSAV